MIKQLAPSILSADFSRLADEVREVEEAGADLIHFDVMDGQFVPNITVGPLVLKSLLGKTSLPFDVHLMISDPDRYAADFVTEQTKYIAVHAEACIHLHRTIQLIHSLGVKAAVALNPATPLSVLDYVIEDVDMVLLMSVNPGFGGQKFIPQTMKKLEALAAWREREGLSFEIEIDGGVGAGNIASIAGAGADIFVAGSAVFGKADRKEAVRVLKEGMGR